MVFMLLAKEVEQATSQVNQLKEEVMQISEVTSVISAISEQTNLLALNAAIEAARAGSKAVDLPSLQMKSGNLLVERGNPLKKFKPQFHDYSSGPSMLPTPWMKVENLQKKALSNRQKLGMIYP